MEKQKRFNKLTRLEKLAAIGTYITQEENCDAAVVGENARTVLVEGSYTLDLSTISEWFDELCDLNSYRFEGDYVVFFTEKSA
jgi:hypothetical protein